MKNRRFWIAGSLMCILAACTHTSPSIQPFHNASAPTSLPYPEPSEREHLEDLATQVARLEQQIAQLNARIQKLENTRTQPAPNIRRQPAPVSEPPPIPTSVRAMPSKNHDQRVQEYYKQGNYREVVQLLRDADSGGDGSLRAQEQMYLLLQSQQKLNHCQSVIQIGQRYVARFAQSTHAADALYAVGQCQWQLQQRDIAKDTWRTLNLRYPNTPAARRATLRLGTNR